MADSNAERRMDALSEAIARLLKRVDTNERRLARIEEALGLAKAESPAPPPPSPPPPQPVMVSEIAAPVAEATEPPPLPPQPRLETRVGLAWANRLGALTVIFAVGFAFKYAFDNDWIGPAGRVLLGILAAVAALAFGDLMWRRGHTTYAQGICGAGISILYLSYYAAYGFYHLVSTAVAIVLMITATAMAGALALRYEALAIAALGLVGGDLTPILLATREDRPWVFFGYLLALNLGAVAVARKRDWRRLEWLSFAGVVLLYGSWFADRFRTEKQVVAAVFAFAFYALYASRPIQAIVLGSQAAAMLVMAEIWTRQPHPFALSMLALAAAGLYLADRRQWVALASVDFAAFWIGYEIWQDAHAAVAPVFLFLTAGFLLFLAWIQWRVLVRKSDLDAPELLLLALNGAAYFGTGYALLHARYHGWLGGFAEAIAAAYLSLAYYLWREMREEERDPRPVVLSLGVALCLLTLAAPIQFSSYRITMAWSMEGAVLVWIALRAGAPKLRWAATAVFALVLVRLLFIDGWIYVSGRDYTAILNGRFLTFATAAAAFWLSVRWLGTGTQALAAYIGGHFAALWVLSLEVIGWAERSAAPGNLASVQSAGISVLLATYAVLLIAIGVLRQSGVNRLMGLSLIAMVVAKLYLWDVWTMMRLHRILAFAALGALLLLTSYLYSRYRGSIESWWKDDPGGE